MTPPLSVVVAVVDGGATLARCLAALAAQRGAPPFEILVPRDPTLADPGGVVARHPAARLVEAAPPSRPAATAAGRHEAIDRRRSAGLAAAAGDVVALLEDRGVPRPDWAAGLLAEHARLPHGAIGGGVDVARGEARAWAAWACDFARYQPPVAPGPRPWLTDVNVGYKRRALEAVRAEWQERYQETSVHWALARAGETLYLSDRFVVDATRAPVALGPLLVERWAAGRRYAATRAASSGAAGRLLHVLAAPLVPFVQLAAWRRERRGAGRRRPPAGTGALLAALFAASSLGEALGEITGRD